MSDHKSVLAALRAGESVQRGYYLPQDAAQEVVAIVRLAIRTHQPIAMQIEDDTLAAAIHTALEKAQLQPWHLSDATAPLPAATIAQWRAWLKNNERMRPRPSAQKTTVARYLQQAYAPLYRDHHWVGLCEMVGSSPSVLQLADSTISGTPEEYRALKRAINRMAHMWRPQYQALLALRLFGKEVPLGEQRLQRLLTEWHGTLLQLLIRLDHSATTNQAPKATRLNASDETKEVLDEIGELYQTINLSRILAFELEDTAHYIDAVRSYAIDVCSRLRLGLDIIATESGLLQWLHHYYRLDPMTQTMVDRLRLYPVEEWVRIHERWYIGEIIRQHRPTIDPPSPQDWQDHLAAVAATQAEALYADRYLAQERTRLALQSIIQQDEKIAHQLLRVELSAAEIIPEYIIAKYPQEAKALWLLSHVSDQDAWLITDSDTKRTGCCYQINRSATRLAPPILDGTGLINQLPVAQRLATVRPLAYWLVEFSRYLNLLVLEGKLVVSTLAPRQVSAVITALGKKFIREIDISTPLSQVTDHLLATDVAIEIWIEGPCIDNRRYGKAAEQYRLLQTLMQAGYQVKTHSQLSESEPSGIARTAIEASSTASNTDTIGS